MNFRKILFLSLFLWLILGFKTTQSQQQYYFDTSNNLFRESLDLIQKEQYGAALKLLALLKENTADQNSVIYNDASYYEVVCTVQLNEKDAAEKVKEFTENQRSSSWMPRVYFLEGRVNFEQKRYPDALAAFIKVNPADLPTFEQLELDYKTGFCQFKQNQPDDALAHFDKIKDVKSPYQNAAIYYYAHIQYIKGNDDDALVHFGKIRTNYMYKKLVPIYEMQINYRKGNFEYVIANGDEVLQLVDNKRKAEIARMIADAYYKNGKYKEALTYYLQFENQNRRQLSREDHYQIGISRYKTANYKDAVNNFQNVINDSDSISQSASYYLAQCYLQTDQKNFALKAFLAAYKANFDQQLSEDALFNYAKLSLQVGPDPYNEAVSLLEKYNSSTPAPSRTLEAQQLIIQLYLNTNNYDAALGSLEKNKKRNTEMQTIYEQLCYSLAIDMFNQRNYIKAIDYFSRITGSKNNSTLSAKALFWLAESYFQQKNYVDAQKYYKQFIAHPGASSTDLLQLASYNLAYSYFGLKQYTTALFSFKQFTDRSYPKDPKLTYDAWNRMGDCYFISKDYQNAIAAYDKVIAVRQTDADYALFQKGLAHGALGQYNLKINALDQIVKQYSQSEYFDNAIYEMATTSIAMNDNRSALAYFDKLIRERPRSPFAREALFKTGLIYFNNNQNEQAIIALKKVAETYPGTPDAREALNTLRAIYMESNQLQEYFGYTSKMGFGEVSISEQDSLAFMMAENFYIESRYNDAYQALTAYLKNNPHGGYLLQAHYYKSKIDLQNKKFDDAVVSLNFIISVNNNPYLEEALLASARISYDKQDYNKAYELYKQLFELSDEPLEKLEALEGKMKSSYFINNYKEAIESSRLLLESDKARIEQQMQAHYIAGKSMYEMRNFNDAKEQLMKTHKMNSGVLGAESYYLLAKISYESSYYDDAEKQIFDLAEKYRNYDYWVAKGFLLLSDIYVKNNNIFQAKETLKSIIENYKGDDLRQEATKKLNMLK